MTLAQQHERSFVQIIKSRITAGIQRTKELIKTTARLFWAAITGAATVAAHAIGAASVLAETGLRWVVFGAQWLVSSLSVLAQGVILGRVLLANLVIGFIQRVFWAALLVLRTPSLLIYGYDSARTDWSLWLSSWTYSEFFADPTRPGRNVLRETANELIDAAADYRDAHVDIRPFAEQPKGFATPKQRKTRPTRLRMA